MQEEFLKLIDDYDCSLVRGQNARAVKKLMKCKRGFSQV